MRASLIFGSMALAAAAAAACARAGDEGTSEPNGDGGVTAAPPVTEGGTNEVDAGPEASVVEEPRCSAAGWCITDLPDWDLALKDIWPLAGHAFAIAESPTLGVKVLEWSDADAKWTYIDDGTQNEEGRGLWVGGLWAPNENDVYFTVSPNHVFHGTRTAPGAPWSWVHHAVPLGNTTGDANPLYWKTPGERIPAFGVWGTGADDVYAWYRDTIYHWSSVDGGAPEWTPEYVADDKDIASEQLNFFAAAGTGTDDVWFSGARSQINAACALLVHKVGGSYERIADGTVPGINRACAERPGSLLIGGTEGWLTDLQAVSATELVGLKGARDAVRLTVDGGGYSVAVATVPTTLTPSGLNSLWTTAAGDELWLAGAGLLVRSKKDGDGDAFEISTTSLNGAPIARPLYQVRGTSNTNLWAIGVRYALHKTTP